MANWRQVAKPKYMSLKVVAVRSEGLARLSRAEWRRFVRGSRENFVSSLHSASTDALIMVSFVFWITT